MLSGNNNQSLFGNISRSSSLFGTSYSDTPLSPFHTGASTARIMGPIRSALSCPDMSLDPFHTAPSPSQIGCPNRAVTISNGFYRGPGGNVMAPNTNFGTSRNPSIGQQVGEPGDAWYHPGFTLGTIFSANPIPPFAAGVGTNTNRAALPNCLLPSVNELLSPRPPFPPRTNQERSPETNQAQNGVQSPQHASQTPRMSTITPSSSEELSGLSTTSSGTIRAPIRIEERRYSLLVTLYRICLEATATYAHSIRRPGHNRRVHGPGQQVARGGRYHPYSLPSLVPPRWRSHRTHGGGEQTLMDYISAICTWLWRRARTDLISPHGAEVVAVRDMRNLYDWSEFLIKHIENHDPENDAGESGSESDMSSLDDGATDQRAGRNARHICRYFRDREAQIACERVCLELGDLSREARRMRATADDSLHEFGNGP